MNRATPAFECFFACAGYAYNPKTESQFAGRVRCAIDLAYGEAIAQRDGYTFEWQYDDSEADRSGIDHDAPLWCCRMRTPDGGPCNSLWSIDFGEHGDPWSDTYGRVVEAELALVLVDVS
jgi:hypothetical protein